jgi:hypothetical protein
MNDVRSARSARPHRRESPLPRRARQREAPLVPSVRSAFDQRSRQQWDQQLVVAD